MKRIGKILFMVLFGAIAILAFGYATMTLWNWLIPDLFGGPIITYWQAFGLLALCKLLFGSFGGGKCKSCRKEGWKQKWKQKCDSMPPEQREAMKERWKAKLEKYCDEETATTTKDDHEKI